MLQYANTGYLQNKSWNKYNNSNIINLNQNQSLVHLLEIHVIS